MKTYPIVTAAGRTVNVTIPENDRDLETMVERTHAERYPNGCPNLCEPCALRLGWRRCGACGGLKPPGQSCGCFDNGCE